MGAVIFRADWTACLAISLALLLTGCSSEDDGRLPVFPVTGSVTFEGKPAEKVVIQLVPQEDFEGAKQDLRPGAVSSADGSFQMMTYSTGDGAPEGNYKLVLFWPPEAPADPLAEMQQEKEQSPRQRKANGIPGGPPDRFGGKYFDPKASAWSVVVKKVEDGAEIQIPEITLP